MKKIILLAIFVSFVLVISSCGAVDPNWGREMIVTRGYGPTLNNELKPVNVNGYLGVNVFLNGVHLDTKDSEGNPIDVFKINNFTYVPAEIIAEILGLEIKWDEQNNALYIGTIYDDYSGVYLGHGIRHLSYRLFGGATLVYDGVFHAVIDSQFNEVRPVVRDNAGWEYTRFLTLFSRENTSYFIYPLDELFRRFRADVALPYAFRDDPDILNLRILGDGRLLYERNITMGHVTEKIDLDVTGVSRLRIEYTSVNPSTIAAVILGNPRLVK